MVDYYVQMPGPSADRMVEIGADAPTELGQQIHTATVQLKAAAKAIIDDPELGPEPAMNAALALVLDLTAHMKKEVGDPTIVERVGAALSDLLYLLEHDGIPPSH